MFILTNVFVEDRHLTKVLTALAGLVIKMDVPRPVINAVATPKGEIKQEAVRDGSVKAELTASILKFNKGTELPISQIKTMIKEAGGSIDSYSYYVSQLKKDKILKLKARGVWLVIPSHA